MDDVAAIRAVLPRHTVKRVADLMNVPLNTAHEWLYRHFSASRRRELAVALLAQLDEQERSRAVVRQHLEQVVTGNEMAGPGGGLAVDEAGGTKDGATIR